MIKTIPPLKNLGGHGPDIVLLHGYGADQQSWLATTPALLDTFTVWVIDLPAHGQSNADCADGSINTLSSIVQLAIDNAGIEHYHIIGHSLGGRIAIQLAVNQPQRVASLVLLAPAGLGEQINEEFLSGFSQATTLETITPLLHSLVHDPRLIGSALSASVLQYLEKPGIRQSLQAISRGLIAAQEHINETMEHICDNNINRLTIWGNNDLINTPDVEKIARFGGATHLLDDCGHLPHIEKRVPVNRLLMAFYEQVLTA